MQVDIDRLMQYTEQGKLRHSQNEGRGLHVWCYSQQTVYSREWDDITLLCRGLVTDSDGTVVSRPYPKFFNWGEPLAPGPDVTSRPFAAYDKEDGTLIVAGLDAHGDLVVSTKGSFSTWHSEEARKMLGDWTPKPGMTGIFEFIHPGNKIVVDYGDFEGLVLLGAVDNEDGSDHYTPHDFAEVTGWTGRLATSRSFNLQSMLRTVADPENGDNREGFVLVWPDINQYAPSPRVKIKFVQYVQLHAILSRLNNTTVWMALKTGTFEGLLELIPDEVYDIVRDCADDLTQRAEQLRDDVIAIAYGVVFQFQTRREQAEYILANYPHSSGLVFGALDGKDIWPKVWDSVRPELDRSWSFLK